MARPTKYTAEVCDRIIEFFDVEPFTEVDRVHPRTGVEYTERVANTLPTVEGFARSLGVSKQTLYTWCDKHPEFLDAFTRARDMQVDHLIQNGLLKHTAEGLTKFMLVNLSEYRDTKHVDQTVRDDLGNWTIDELEAELARVDQEQGQVH